MRDQVADLWNKGKTSGEIAYELGMTRSQVMGIVFRARKAGLITRPKIDTPQPKKVTANVKAVRLRAKVITPLKPIAISETKKVDPPKTAELPTPQIKIEPVQKPVAKNGTKTILQLGAYDCRYILDDGKYCGAESNSIQTPWCEEHHKLVYIPGTAKKNLKIFFRF